MIGRGSIGGVGVEDDISGVFVTVLGGVTSVVIVGRLTIEEELTEGDAGGAGFSIFVHNRI